MISTCFVYGVGLTIIGIGLSGDNGVIGYRRYKVVRYGANGVMCHKWYVRHLAIVLWVAILDIGVY